MRRFARYAVVPGFAAALWAAACTRREVVGVVIDGVEVRPATAVLEAGDSLRLAAVVRDDRGNAVGDVTAEWSSSSPAVVVVTEAGWARGLQTGVADVTATFSGRSGTARIVVTASPSFELEVTESAGSTAVTEAGGTDGFVVRLLARPVSDVVLVMASDDTGEVTVAPSTLTFSPSTWNVAQGVTVIGVDDAIVDGSQVTSVSVRVDASLSDPTFAGTATVSVDVVTLDDESASVALMHTDGSTVVTEGGGGDSISVMIGATPASNVVLDVTVDDPGDAAVEPTAITFVPAGPTSQWVRVVAVDDPRLDGDRTRTITVSVNAASDPLFRGHPSQSLQATTIDDDVAGYTVSETAGGTMVGEGGSTDVFTVTLDAQPSGNVILRVTSADLSEAAVSPATLVFAPAGWDQPQTVTVIGVDDSTGDGDQEVQITVSVDPASDPAFTSLPPETVTATNADDDNIGFTVSETGGTVVNEAGTLSDAIAIRLNTVPVGNVVLSVTSSDPGEASVAPQTLTFTPANGSQAQGVVVSGVNDQRVDGDVVSTIAVSVNTTLTLDAAYDTVSAELVHVTTLDDEIPSVGITETGGSTIVDETGTTDSFAIVLSAEPLSDVVLAIASGDQDEVVVDSASVTFTPASWSVPKVVTVRGVDDGIPDGDATSAVSVSVDDARSDPLWHDVADRTVTVTTEAVDPSFTVMETGGGTAVGESGPGDSFTVVLGSRPASNVIMSVVSDDPTETAVDSATVTFTPTSWDAPKTVVVSGVDDAVVDGTRISAVTVTVLAGSDGGFVVLPPQSVTVTTADDEVPGLLVVETGGGTTVDEGAVADTFSVALAAQPLTDVVLAFSSGDLGEVSLDPPVWTFTPADWSTPRLVTVGGVEDGMEDGDQVTPVTIAVVDASSDDRWDDVASAIVNVTTLDITAGYTITELGGSTTVDESGATDAFTVVLDEAPSTDVVLTITSTDAGEVVTDSATLTFTPATWDAPQTVIVSGVDDPTVDGPQASTVWVAVSGVSDPAFAGLPPQGVIVTTTDDDAPGFVVTEIGGSTAVAEGGATDLLTVVLLAQPLTDVVLGVGSNDLGEVTVDSTTLTFTPATWSTPKTVTVRGVNDAVADGPQTAIVTISVGPGSDAAFASLGVQTVSVVNADDEIADFAITQTQGTTQVSESGSSDSFQVVLLSRPASTVTITIFNPVPGEASVTPTVVSFTPGQWNSPRTVTVTGVDDAIADGDQITQLVVAVDDANSNDLFDSAPDQIVSVTTVDNEP